jgi:hypothetical protein
VVRGTVRRRGWRLADGEGSPGPSAAAAGPDPLRGGPGTRGEADRHRGAWPARDGAAAHRLPVPEQGPHPDGECLDFANAGERRGRADSLSRRSWASASEPRGVGEAVPRRLTGRFRATLFERPIEVAEMIPRSDCTNAGLSRPAEDPKVSRSSLDRLELERPRQAVIVELQDEADREGGRSMSWGDRAGPARGNPGPGWCGVSVLA